MNQIEIITAIYETNYFLKSEIEFFSIVYGGHIFVNVTKLKWNINNILRMLVLKTTTIGTLIGLFHTIRVILKELEHSFGFIFSAYNTIDVHL